MRINLLFNSPEVRGGYVNIDPFAEASDERKVAGSIFNLDDFADNAEVMELVALDIIDRVPLNQVPHVLGHWLGKIRRGGSIAIGGINLPSLTKAYYRKDIDLAAMNSILFGPQIVPGDIKKNALDISWMESALKAKGFKIIQSRIQGFHYYIKAERI